MAQISKVVHFESYSNSIRQTPSASATNTSLTFTFTKKYSDTDLIIQSTVPVRGGSNGNYSYVEIGSTKRRTGIAKTYYAGEHMILINQCWSGLPSGQTTINFGWATNNASSDTHWSALHPNNSDDSRNRQTGSNWLIWEVKTTETAASTVVDTDPYWSNVVLLVKDGSTTDYTGRHSITTNGSATTVSSTPPFKSNYGPTWSLGQNSSSYLSYGNNLGDFSLGSNTIWTLEFWSYLANTGNYAHYFTPGGQDAQGTFKNYWQGARYRPYMYSGAGLMVGSNVDTTVSGSGTWVHQVYQRNGSELRLWLNGDLVETSSSGGSIPTSTPSYSRSGAWSGESQPFYLDELRLTLGVARYGSSQYIPIQSKTWPTS
jgi:hypothetical protein